MNNCTWNKSEMVGSFVSRRVPDNLVNEFWKHFRKWDETVTTGTFYDKDVMETMLNYAIESRGE